MSSQGIRIPNPALEPLRPVLQAWIHCTQRYVELFDGGDLPYWHNERANVGILSAAAWQAGMVALEEFQSMKISSPSDSPHADLPDTHLHKGRCDLYLSNAEHEFFIEAKVCYPLITNTIDCFQAGMDRMALDRRNVGATTSHHLSALFCAPYAHRQAASAHDIAQHLALAQAQQVDAHAWVEPAQAQHTPSHNHSYYPLVSLFIKLVQAPQHALQAQHTHLG